MKLSLATAAVIALGAFSMPAVADTAPKPVTKTAAKDPNKQICRTIEVVGSRLAEKKICHTQAEWDAVQAADRQAIEHSQTQRWGQNGS